ncbi:MAG: cold shock domain-containing protein [Pseudomonadales bacterium]
MPTGKVKWFNNAKGYGFILPEDGAEDLFVHYSSIQMEGYKTLKAGQTVQYETLKSAKGFHAVDIRAATDEEEAPPSVDEEEAPPSVDEAPAAERAAEPSQSDASQETTTEATETL